MPSPATSLARIQKNGRKCLTGLTAFGGPLKVRCALPPATAFQPCGLLESNKASIIYVCTTPVTCLCSCSCSLPQFIGAQPSIGIAVFRGKRGPSMLFKSGCPGVGEQVMLLSYPQAHVEGLPTSHADPAIHQGLVSQVCNCNLVGGSDLPGNI